VDTVKEADDATLLRRAAAGDQDAFAELYDRLAPMVLIRLRRRCSDDELAADVMQETFAAAWRAAGSWEGRGDVGAWVWTIAARRLVDAFRRRDARASTVHWEPHQESETAASPSAEEQILDGLLAGPLEAAVRSLSPELRAVLQATVLDGMTTREAAIVLRIPEGTVKARAWRARTALRKALA
jgi:RNA polymerase sigma-70 factor, ECF subfamily